MGNPKSNSFVENVNTIANAVNLVTGDVVHDTVVARDEAKVYADKAKVSETTATSNAELAREWAENGHNVPVVSVGPDKEYSSYHWSVEAKDNIHQFMTELINDGNVSGNFTWSSSKINSELLKKSNTDHVHYQTYAPWIGVPKTAYNKNFTPVSVTGSGVSEQVARRDHDHDGRYERFVAKKDRGTAYDLDFGTVSGTVMEGDTNFDTRYLKLLDYVKSNNLNPDKMPWVVDVDHPQFNEVPRGNHGHKAREISYVPSSTPGTVATGADTQAAISQLDTKLSAIDVAEKSYINVWMTDSVFQVTNGGAQSPNKINAGMTISATTQNADYSNSGMRINYTDLTKLPAKKIEGIVSFMMTVKVEAGHEYSLGIAIQDIPIDPKYRVTAGKEGGTDAGYKQLSLTLNVSGLSNMQKIQPILYTTSTSSSIEITEYTGTMSLLPEGALVLSGTTINHADLDGLGGNRVHTISDIPELVADLATRAKLVPSPVKDNLVSQDIAGNVVDSGISKSAIGALPSKPANPILNRIMTMDAAGNSLTGSKTIAELALVGGDATNKFKVAEATTGDEAVRYSQVTALAQQYVKQTDFNTHTGAVNPHNITPVMIDAAPKVHTHVIADVALLQDKLDAKYSKVTGIPSFNLLSVDNSNAIIDSGVSAKSTLLTGEPV